MRKLTEFEKEMLEQLANIEHLQWERWSKAIVKQEPISEKRIQRWKRLWVDYRDLTEKEKKEDRKFARIVLELLRTKNLIPLHPKGMEYP